MSKRIALIGNMNNNFFALACHLRDFGYDANLFYSPRSDHFHPKADTYSLNYTRFTHEVNWLDKGFYNCDLEQVHKDLDGFDFFIGQGDETAVVQRAGINFNVYYPYGSDVHKYAQMQQEFTFFEKVTFPFRKQRYKPHPSVLKHGTSAKYLRSAIVNADYVLADYTNEEFERKIRILEVKGKYQNIALPFLYMKEYEQINQGYIPDVHWKTVIDDIRKQNDLVLLYHGRQEWKAQYSEFSSKETHHLIIGFANYIRKNPSKKACLVMLEYGVDLYNSKQLVKELGISAHVIWLPKMYRKDIMYLISKVDICSGEFGLSYLTFGTIVEAMLMRKPVIHYRDDAMYTQYEELYPLLNARLPEEIEQAVAFADNNRQVLADMGNKAHDWIQKYFITRPLEYLVDIIEGRVGISVPDNANTTEHIS